MVTILLATYNGEKFIAEQLDSILSQTFSNFKIVVRDDGSTDSTPIILENYREINPDKITIIKDSEPTGSAAGNFFKLLELNRDDYIMLCDQDDIWLPDKIEVTLKAMQTAERESPETPILVHTDLKVADENLNIIAPSFFKFQGLSPERRKLNNLLMQNSITGCTAMLNKPLCELLFTYPEGCAMHDWWIGILAAAFGEIVVLYRQTMLYRQHSDNEVGAKNAASLSFLMGRLKSIQKSREMYKKISYQAEFLLTNYSSQLNHRQRRLLRAVADLPNMNKWKKIKTIRRFELQKNSFLRNLAQYILI